MTIQENKKEIFDHWNSKGIVVHKRMGDGLAGEIGACLKKYDIETIKETIDLYAEIMEIGLPLEKRKYFWTYKWNLSEFLMRGVKKFDGQEASNYLRRQEIDTPTAVVFKRS
jgi:hypothetical protein